MLHDNCMDRLQKLRKINHGITEIMKRLATKSYVQIQCCPSEEYYIRLHIAIGSHYAELPEEKDMLEVKPSKRTMQRFPICHSKRNEQAFFRDIQSITSKETKKLFDECDLKMKLFNEMKHRNPSYAKMAKNEADKMIDDNSIKPVLTVLHKVPFVKVASVLFIYIIYNLEHMQKFHLGTLNILKNLSMEKIRSVKIKTNNWYLPGFWKGTPNSVTTAVTKTMNKYVEHVTMNSDGVRLGL